MSDESACVPVLSLFWSCVIGALLALLRRILTAACCPLPCARHAVRFGLRAPHPVLLVRVIGAISGRLLRVPAAARCPLPFVHGIRRGVVCEVSALPLLGLCVDELFLAFRLLVSHLCFRVWLCLAFRCGCPAPRWRRPSVCLTFYSG